MDKEKRSLAIACFALATSILSLIVSFMKG